MLVRFGEGQEADVGVVASGRLCRRQRAPSPDTRTRLQARLATSGPALCARRPRALELAAREGRSDHEPLLAAVEACAATVFRSIEALQERAQSTVAATLDGRPFDSALAGAALERLTEALDDFDLSSAGGALADLERSGLPGWAHDDLRRLHQSVDGYEYGEARGIASRLLARVHAGDA